MPITKNVVAHILRHVDAEDAKRDLSQVAGVAERAQYVRDAVQGLAEDTKDNPIDTILATISDDVPLSDKQASFKRTLTNMMGEPRSQLAIQAWVGQGKEQRGG
ncbi:hypothetical protein LCGC14_1476220 [marine sediment metagenome]|uniref:Uncharacterized protein n=1 Tax=marine sediment metagenome TaxID=412755 RepID=A0A0F9MCL4_9ZZZZ